MASSSYYNSIIMISFTLFLVMVSMASFSSAQLSPGFYSKSCPKALSTIRSGVQSAISKENRIGASILRLFFHDCFVHGCDGSILLEDTPTFKGEQTARPNNRSARGFGVVEAIKAKVEAVCPGVVSCADVLAIAARDSVVILGGPNWDVKLGRRDSKTASFKDANDGRLPGPASNLTNLIRRFQAVGLSARDMVALSGAHTIGQARCTTFRAHIYNDTNIDPSFAKHRQSRCPKTVGKGDDILAPLDFQTPNGFDNKYFQHLVIKKGLLHSDQVLYNGDSTDSLVKTYSQNPKTFNCDFVKAMIKMGDFSPLTGSRGEIRKKCGRPN